MDTLNQEAAAVLPEVVSTFSVRTRNSEYELRFYGPDPYYWGQTARGRVELYCERGIHAGDTWTSCESVVLHTGRRDRVTLLRPGGYTPPEDVIDRIIVVCDDRPVLVSSTVQEYREHAFRTA